jgi:threonine dehydrogenase-like Zn-dependent dehydrogenase
MARKGGKVILVGFSGGRELTIKPDFDLVEKELTVRGSYLSAHAYTDSMEIIQSDRFPLRQLITHIFPLKDVDKAYDLISKRADKVLKVLLDPWMAD